MAAIRRTVMVVFNPLLDAFPADYKGYLIRTDFRIGIQIVQAAADENLAELEKIAVMINLLYGEGAPQNLEFALAGLEWFMSGGTKNAENDEGLLYQDETEGDAGEKESDFDFDYDAMRLLTAFRKTYGVDLKTARLHWFEFRAMIADLGECAFTHVVEYRSKDLTDLPPKQRSEYAKLKKKYALPRRLSEEDAEKVNEFMSALSTAN